MPVNWGSLEKPWLFSEKYSYYINIINNIFLHNLYSALLTVGGGFAYHFHNVDIFT